jgi:hypothetical protein
MSTERTDTDQAHDASDTDATPDQPSPAMPDAPAVDVQGATTTADLARAGSASPDAPAVDDEADGRRTSDDEERTALFEDDAAADYRGRWQAVQTDFVDDPRQAVERADALVAELMQRLAETFASERSDLEAQWASGAKVSTEDLRVAMQRYRSFFDRLLSL